MGMRGRDRWEEGAGCGGGGKLMARCEHEFSWDKIAETTENVYYEVAGRQPIIAVI